MTTPAPLRPHFCACLALLAAACAAPRPPPAAARRSLPALPRSSVAAVLTHRQELRLDEAQVRGLQEIDDELAKRQETALRGDAPAPPPPAAIGEGDEGALGRRGGGHRGGRERQEAEAHPVDRDRLWNDNDTSAFHEAEGLLRPDQVERARDIAEKFRERRYDLRAPASSGATRSPPGT